jgi:DNA-binding MarR family transcriptional regulator
MPNAKEEPCVCSQLRRTARLVSLFYDDALAPAGISVTQYALLARIGRVDGLSRTALAAQLGMDRTTLTRNLALLERGGLVANKRGEDRREKLLYLTASGRKQAAIASPRWYEAQEQMLKHLGKKRWHELQELLSWSEQVLDSKLAANGVKQ